MVRHRMSARHPMSGNPLVRSNAIEIIGDSPAERHRMFLKHPMSGIIVGEKIFRPHEIINYDKLYNVVPI